MKLFKKIVILKMRIHKLLALIKIKWKAIFKLIDINNFKTNQRYYFYIIKIFIIL